jgi:hypothetical protein
LKISTFSGKNNAGKTYIYIPLDDLEPDNIPLNQTFRREKQLASQVRRKGMNSYVHPIYVHKLEGNEAWSEALRVLLFHQNEKASSQPTFPSKHHTLYHTLKSENPNPHSFIVRKERREGGF